MFILKENVLLWNRFLGGGRNERADVEGPYYLIGAPKRDIAEGKVVLASIEDLQAFKPFLLAISLKSPSGDPLPNATIDLWQATTAGEYSFTSYRLRGIFTSDKNGLVEILTVAPGKYGPEGYKRAGHFHLIVRPEVGKEGETEELTTQIYVCEGNDVKEMGSDFINYVRPSRPQNMLTCYSTSKDAYMNFPPLPSDDVDSSSAVQWWNDLLKEKANGEEELTVAAYGRTELRLSKPSAWFGL